MIRKLKKKEEWLAIAGLAGILLLVMFLSLFLGSVLISPVDLLNSNILWQIRLPSVVLAAFIGLLLSISGVLLQGVLRTPLADPYILGISAGGAVGAAVAVALGASFSLLGMSSLPATAFIFSLAAVYVVYKLSQVAGK